MALAFESERYELKTLRLALEAWACASRAAELSAAMGLTQRRRRDDSEVVLNGALDTGLAGYRYGDSNPGFRRERAAS